MRLVALAALVVLAAACGGADRAVTTTSATTAPTGPTTVVLERIEVPPGILAAMPQQNRDDPAKGQFQVQLVNGTDERFKVVSVQFVWDGYTTPVAVRDDSVVPRQRIDFPVKFPGATCVGDGGAGSMPDIMAARVLVGVDDGRTLEVPVFDTFAVARKLYLKDCERQALEAAVHLEWVGLRRVDHEGRPVTEGVLRAERLGAEGAVTVLSIGETIPFRPVVVGAASPVLVLDEDAARAEVAVRFLEGRCDPHALAEVKQPFKFVLQVDLGDGEAHPFVLMPPEEARIPMQQTAAEGCEALGLTEPLG